MPLEFHIALTHPEDMATTARLPAIVADDRVLRAHLKQLDMAAEVGAATASMSMADILAEMRRVKEAAEEEKRKKRGPDPYVPPGGWKHDPTVRMTLGEPKKKFVPAVQDRSVAQFHVPQFPVVWDRSVAVDSVLSKALYRIPCRDPSGKVYFSVTRDTRGGELAGEWRPNGKAKKGPLAVLPPASAATCSTSFRESLVAHTERAIEKVESLYKELPEYTERLRNIKARVGADLNNLQRARSKVIEQLHEGEEFRRSRSPSRSRSASPTRSLTPSMRPTTH